MKPVRIVNNFHLTPERAPPPPKPIVGTPVQLTPIPWGKPDPKLARVVLQHIAETTPAIVIPFNPLTDEKTRRSLRSNRIDHH